MKKLIAIAALLLAACTTSNSTDSTTDSTGNLASLTPDQQEAARLNSTVDTSAVAVATNAERPSRMPLLAIEVELTADGIKPLGARIVHVPRIMNGAHDDVRVKVEGTDWEYTFADPLLAKVHDESGPRAVELESVRRTVFVPLLPAARRLSIEPVEGKPALRIRGGTIELRELAKEACRRTQLRLPVCNQILAQP